MRGRALDRRTVLLTGVLGLTLSGCALNNPFSTPDEPAAAPERPLAADVGIAILAIRHLEAISAVVRATTTKHPALTTRLAGFTETHQAHLDALRAAVPDRVTVAPTPTPYIVPVKRAGALVGVQRQEASVHDMLIALAMRAESGPLARLLGTMAAAVSQQLAVLAR